MEWFITFRELVCAAKKSCIEYHLKKYLYLTMVVYNWNSCYAFICTNFKVESTVINILKFILLVKFLRMFFYISSLVHPNVLSSFYLLRSYL